jgi:hypothetical protein
MEFEVFGQVFVSKSGINCLECQHLYQPNPGEEILICLRTLDTISHEIEDVFGCDGFEELKSSWDPVYVPEVAGVN